MALASISYIFRVFIEGFLIFINKGSLSISRSFKAAKTRLVDNIKGVDVTDLVNRIVQVLKGDLYWVRISI